MTSPRRRSRRRRTLERLFVLGIAAVAIALVAGTAAVWFDIGGLRERAGSVVERIALVIDPPPDRPIDEEVVITPKPEALPSATPVPTATPTLAPGQTAAPTPAPTPTPRREPVDVNIISKPKQHFITEIDHEWCAVAATQMVLAMHDAAPLTDAFQVTLANRVGEWERLERADRVSRVKQRGVWF